MRCGARLGCRSRRCRVPRAGLWSCRRGVSNAEEVMTEPGPRETDRWELPPLPTGEVPVAEPETEPPTTPDSDAEEDTEEDDDEAEPTPEEPDTDPEDPERLGWSVTASGGC